MFNMIYILYMYSGGQKFGNTSFQIQSDNFSLVQLKLI